MLSFHGIFFSNFVRRALRQRANYSLKTYRLATM